MMLNVSAVSNCSCENVCADGVGSAGVASVEVCWVDAGCSGVKGTGLRDIGVESTSCSYSVIDFADETGLVCKFLMYESVFT